MQKISEAVALLAACWLLASPLNAPAAPVVLDFTTANQTGSISGAVFSNPANRMPVGTGVILPFLSIQMKGTEAGLNADGGLQLDTKRPNFTNAIHVGDIGTVVGDGTFGVSGTI